MQRLFSSRRKKKRPRLKDATVPTAAVVAMPSTPLPPTSPQGQPVSGASLTNIAGDKLHHQAAGQSQVYISFSQSGRNSTGQTSHSSIQSSINNGQSALSSNSQLKMTGGQHHQVGVTTKTAKTVDLEGRSPKLKPALLPYSASSSESKNRSKQHKSSPQQNQQVTKHNQSVSAEQERSSLKMELSDEDSPTNPLYSTVRTSLYSRVRGKGNRDELITKSEVENVVANHSSDAELDEEVVVAKKKEPVYSKVVKKFSQLKSEKKKHSSGALPPRSPSSLKEKHRPEKRKNKLPPQYPRKEASVRFADKEKTEESPVHLAEKQDLQEDVVEKFVDESEENIAKGPNTHAPENEFKQHEETAAAHYEEDWKGSRVHKTTKYTPTMSYSQRNISKVVLPMGYKGDQDELEYKEEEYQQSTTESKTLSFSFSDEEEEDSGTKQLNSTYPPMVKAKAKSGSDVGPRLHSSMTSPANPSKETADREMDRKRSSSVPPILGDLPVIKPSTLQKATTSFSSDVYIFSERQSDGRVQYFAASPVHYATTTGFTTDCSGATSPPEVPLKTQTSVCMGSGEPVITQSIAYTRENRQATSPMMTESHDKEREQTSSLPHRKPGSVTSLNKKEKHEKEIPRTSTPLHQKYPNVGGNVSVGKISTIGSKDVVTKAAVSQDFISSLSDISLDDSFRLKSGMRSATEGIDGRHRSSDEPEADKRRVQELVDLLAAERKAVEAEKHISALMEEELKDMKILMVDLKAENERLLKIIKDLEHRREKLKKAETDLERANADNFKLKMELKRLEGKADRQKQHYINKLTKLTSQLQFMSDKHTLMESEMSVMRENHAQLRHKFERLKASIANYISLDEHKEALENMQSLVDDLTDRNEETMLNQQSTIKVQSRRNETLIKELADAEKFVIKLKEENKILRKSCMAAEEKVINLQMEVEQYKNNEVALHQQLAKLVTHAEKTMADKTALEKVADAHKFATEKLITSRSDNMEALAAIQKKINAFEKDTSTTLDKATKLLVKSERNHQNEKKQYMNEIRQLRAVLSSKHAQLSELLLEKKKAEERLDFVYKSQMSSQSPRTSSRAANDLLQAPRGSSKSRFGQPWTQQSSHGAF